MTPLPPDEKLSLLNFFDVPSIAAFACTTKSNNRLSCLSFGQQFGRLLNYCECQYGTSVVPSLAKRIYGIWKKIPLETDENSYKTLNPTKKVFDLLKMFYNIIPSEDHPQVLSLNCPSLISEMVKLDNEEDQYWKDYNYQESMNVRVELISNEFNRIGLFQEGFFRNFKGIPELETAAFFIHEFLENKSLFFVAFHADSFFQRDCSIKTKDQINKFWMDLHEDEKKVLSSVRSEIGINLKWAYIKVFYEKYFVKSEYGFPVPIPISDAIALKNAQEKSQVSTL
jgi:hypothetical protein